MEAQRVVGSRDRKKKRTVFGDLPGESARAPSAGAKADSDGAKPDGGDDAVVDAFWRDALDSIS